MTTSIVTKKTETFRFRKTFLPSLLTGESITAIWAPHGGRRKAMVYLSQNASKFGFQKLGKYKILYIDNNDLTGETPLAYFQLLLKNLNSGKLLKKAQDKEGLFACLKQKVGELTQKGFHLIFILGHFDELNFPLFFFNNLRSLQQINKAKVHFIFAVSKNIFSEESLKRYGQLRELIYQNLVYFPLFSHQDSCFVAKYFRQTYGYKLSPEKQELAIKLSGGHPSLIKTCLRIFYAHPKSKKKDLLELLAQQLETKMILGDIWNSLQDSDKAYLILLTHGNLSQNNKPSERLLKLKIILSKDESSLKLFSPLFESFVKSQADEGQTLSLNFKTGEILINGFPPKEKLTLQEYHLLVAFLKKPKIIISRDEIADILWSKKSYEKYSDWAIDQNISQLRKRLAQMGVSPKNLQTIRDRGYRWIG